MSMSKIAITIYVFVSTISSIYIMYKERENINVQPSDVVTEEDIPNTNMDEKKDNSIITNDEINNNNKQLDIDPNPVESNKVKVLKDVGEAYMDNFGLTDTDFLTIKNLGIDIIEGNFDICATDEDVKYLLDKSLQYNIKVIMPAGSGEAEWGYECDKDPYPSTQKPTWNKDAVVNWINKWKYHKAIHSWDISNEAGSVFPNPSEDNMLTLEQLKQAYADVKATDSSRPIMIRMNGWYFYDYDSNFFRIGNPFGNKVADIVMINAYSNVDEYFTDFVQTVTERAYNSIKQIDPKSEIYISLGTWKEPPLWVMPDINNLNKELQYLISNSNVKGIAYFKYGAENSEWYLPQYSNLIEFVSQNL